MRSTVFSFSLILKSTLKSLGLIFIYLNYYPQLNYIRIISNCNRRTSITPFYHKLGILKILELYKFEIAKLMHQHSKQNLPPTISNLFKPLSNIHNRIIRSVSLNHIYVENFSTLRCRRSIKYQGAKIWNAIPLELRDQSYRNFKLNYKKILLERYQICT